MNSDRCPPNMNWHRSLGYLRKGQFLSWGDISIYRAASAPDSDSIFAERFDVKFLFWYLKSGREYNLGNNNQVVAPLDLTVVHLRDEENIIFSPALGLLAIMLRRGLISTDLETLFAEDGHPVSLSRSQVCQSCLHQ